ncbi:MAG: family 1 encapsulin nanocompartment shell protein [Solirubrobacterales bacterium]
MNHLLRSLAPITDSAWELLDKEARGRLSGALAARRLVDFSGPHGWEHSATNLGRASGVKSAPAKGITGSQRQVLALIEVRAGFSVEREELRSHDRGAVDVDLGELDDAAHRMAIAENTAVFHGWPAAGISGITEVAPGKPISLGKSAEAYPRAVAGAVERLLQRGIGGPYGLALGPEEYTRVSETAEHGGYPLLDHLAKVLSGPIVWAPGVSGAVVVSLRGGDFLFECGQDLSIGYERHDEGIIRLYLEESFAFVVATPEAAVALSS